MPLGRFALARLRFASCLVLLVGLAVAAPAQAQYSNLVARHDFKCLDVAGVSPATGAPVQQWECLGPNQHNQQWSLRAIGDGYVQIVARHSGKCLDVTGVSLANGTPVQQWDCLGAGQTNQHWLLRTVTGAGSFRQIVARHSGKCLDVSGVSFGNGARIQQWQCIGATQRNQLWLLAPIG
jgi:hypothetical protein